MELTLLLLVPLAAGLLCLGIRSRLWWERVNLAAFVLVMVLAAFAGWKTARERRISELGGFLQADALSALVIALTAFVALLCAIYAVGYFRRELREGRINETQLRLYYT